MSQPKPFDIEKLVRVPGVAGYDLSPDGKTAAIVWNKSGQWEIYLVNTLAEGTSRAKRITNGPQSKVAPHFSPDGRRLAYGQDYGGDERFDIFVYDLDSGATRNLTPDTPDETIAPDVAWSPDGREIAFVSDRGGRFATYILPVDGSAPARRLTEHEYSDAGVTWSTASPDAPCGRLAITALTTGQETWVFIADPGDESTRTVAVVGRQPGTAGDAQGPIDAHSPRWSPDGTRLALASNAPGISAIFTYDLSSGALTQQTEATHEAAEPDWSPSGDRLAFTWNEDGNVCLGVKDLASGEVTYRRVAPGVHSAPRFAPDGRLLTLFAGAGYPEDLWVFGPGRRASRRQLTRSLPKTFSGREFVTPRVVRWQSDGLSIAGLLYLPRGFRRRRSTAPAVVWVHGGPTWQYKNEWYVAVQALVSEGFVVLAPNYRGSTGYGRAFQEANRFDLGGGDMRDVIAGAEFLVREGYARPGRLGITGASYGGYLTMTALTRHPRVFAAGSAVVPFVNWFTEHASERADLQYWDRENFGDPVKDADRYREYSPIFYLENIAAPVQLIAGANDPRCPAAETEQTAAALRQMEVPHEVVIYPDEGHSFRKLENRLDAARRRTAFLRRYLAVDGARAAKSQRARVSAAPKRGRGRG